LATLRAIEEHHPTRPHEVDPAVTPAVSDLVMRLLEKAPDHRSATAAAVVEEIEQIEQGLPVSVTLRRTYATPSRASVTLSGAKGLNRGSGATSRFFAALRMTGRV